MQLPVNLNDRPFAEWNYLVRGLMEAWEVARILGEEAEFERLVAQDPDGTVVELFGEAGNHSARKAVDIGRPVLAGAGSPVSEVLRAQVDRAACTAGG